MPKSIPRFLLHCLVFGLISISAAQSGFAQDARPQPNGVASAAHQRDIQYANSPAELLAKAQNRGQLRVIVGLNTSALFKPEGELTTAQASIQRSGVTQAKTALLNSLAPYGATVLAQSNQWTIPYLALRVNAAGLQALQASSAVSSIQEDHMNFLSNNEDSLDNMAVPPVWANGYDGSGNTIAILDNGVQTAHTFIGGRVVQEYCISTDDLVTDAPYIHYLPLCPGLRGEGVNQSWGTNSASPVRCAALAAANGFDELCDHGTHVAGIAAGNDGNDSTVNDGVARAAKIIAVQVFTYVDCVDSNIYCQSSSDDAVTAFDSDIIDGLSFVYYLRNQYKIAAVNMSLAGGYFTSQAACDSAESGIKLVIDLLRAANIATIIASGNDGYGSGISGPACISTAVAVGAVSDNGELPDFLSGKIWSYTNTNFMLDLLAPGYDIYSSITVPTNTGFGWMDGTSMAAPQVTGAWAVVREPFPNATVTQVLKAFQATGTPVLDDVRADGFPCFRYPAPPYIPAPCSGLTFKEINVDAAINYLQPATPVLTSPTSSVMTSNKPKLTWTATGATHYKVFLDTVNPPLAELTEVNTPSYTLLTPLEGTVYYWQVEAFNDLGSLSTLSDIGIFSVDVPANRNYTTDTTPTLTWTPITGATSYEVQIADNSTFTLNSHLYSALPSDSLSFEVTIPLSIGTHYWRVRATGGTGSYSPAEILVIGS